MLLIPTYVVQILSSFNKTLIFSNGLPEVFGAVVVTTESQVPMIYVYT